MKILGGYRDSTANRTILASTLRIGSLTAVVSVAGAAREVFVADEFGVSRELDAFVLALALIAFAVAVASGSLTYAFLPAYVKVRAQRGAPHARELLMTVTARGMASTIALAVVIALASQLVVSVAGTGFDHETLSLTRNLFLILLPVLPIKALASIWAAVLNASERFALTSAAPLAIPIATVVAMILLAGRYSAYALAIGTLVGFAAEATLLAVSLARQGLLALPRWSGSWRETEGVMRQYGAVAIGAVLMGSTVLVDNAMASRLGPGSVSALSYGGRLPLALAGLGAMALGTAVLPQFSKLVAASRIAEFFLILRFWTRAVLVALVPVTIALVVLSETTVRLLYERGAFSAADTRLVAGVQGFYFLQVPFYVLAILSARVLSAIRRNELLAVMALVSVILNIGGNVVLSHYLGVRGIALSTAIVYASTAALGFAFIRSRRWGLSSVQPADVEVPQQLAADDQLG